ncbi:hypothetical protein NVP1113A_61 [Vibrio phage 1.113.A._10N.286.51.E7]|nr:hypothetical protein NVP1113A_61 [Vibrio phage 1.113.A._10N.286.51.E7]
MSEAKFTDGPWCIKEIEGDKEYIRVRGTRLGKKFKIANVIDLKTNHDESNWRKADRAESLANAHLIAASPDMYKALVLMIRYANMLEEQLLSRRVEVTTLYLDDKNEQPPEDIAELALAKARGEK